jgi:putative FmdB family regulatory protein
MPLYDYECFDCGKGQEYFCAADMKPARLACPKCGGSCRQVFIAAPAVHGDELVPYQRAMVGNKHVPGQIQNNKAVAMGLIPGIETRSQFNQAIKDKQLSLDRDIKMDFHKDMG